MSNRTTLTVARRAPLLNGVERLTRPERLAIVLMAIAAAGFDLAMFFMVPGTAPVRVGLSMLSSLSLIFFVWSPLPATLMLGSVVVLSLLHPDTTMVAAFPFVIAAALVLRTGDRRLVIGYGFGLLSVLALFSYRNLTDQNTLANAVLFLVFAFVCAGIGLALRAAYARGHRLERELAEQVEREREAVLAERRWIAGELHDSIAHYLTIIAMHVQMLDDDEMRPDSTGAIRVATRKALSDLRFVIGLAEDAPRGTGVPAGDLSEAIDEACQEFEAAGHITSRSGDPRDERIPRGVEIVLTRIVRESATNVIKYAGSGGVDFALDIAPSRITLTMRSPLPDTPRRDLPSTGTGLNRMAERVLGVSGEFFAGPDGNTWIVSASLPTEYVSL